MHVPLQHHKDKQHDMLRDDDFFFASTPKPSLKENSSQTQGVQVEEILEPAQWSHLFFGLETWAFRIIQLGHLGSTPKHQGTIRYMCQGLKSSIRWE